jgi:hypothetical protein
MSSDSSVLMVDVQMALGLSPTELGALIGVTKRTIQRWQARGVPALDEEEATILADSLRPTHPPLADAVMALHLHFLSYGRVASPEALSSIFDAVAAAGNLSADAARPLVEAAFRQAGAQGLDVRAVLVGLAALRGAT